ncbi:MAG: CinA family nicotinamide mononucleotide deamidase-related protein, partial [Oscillospiraceae bacterium]
MRAEIICVGTELLLGDILNTNAQFLSRELSQLGIAMYNQQVVGDNGPRLAQAVSIAKQRCDIVILSGGLGPTEDDLTKQTVAQLFNDELVYSIGVEKDIQAYFDRIKQPMAENNRRQAFVPKNGKYIKNENGTAPGIIFIEGEKMAILLPGPPKELMPMVENDVVPLLKKLVCGVIKSKYIKTIGIGESMLETKISDILAVSNPSAALYAKTGEVTIRITANADNSQEAEGALRAQMAALDKRISDYIYGVDVENIE